MDTQFDNTKQYKYIYYTGAFLSFLISFIVFLKTMAPTLSFWDCGEFIACAYTLGVPHPPGTPMFILIGKFFIQIGLFETPAQNTNFISVLSSALTVMMAYIIIVKVTRHMIDRKTDQTAGDKLSYFGILIGAFSGSLILAFSSTFWFNAVETEVYGLAMLVMMIITYMMIAWGEQKATSGSGDKILIGVVYILFLSISIHLTSFLITPALVIFMALVDREKARDWRFWVCWGILFSFASPVYLPIQMMIPSLFDYQMETWMFLMVASAVFFGINTLTNKSAARQKWGFYFAIMVVAIIGFTPHIYIPIRAAHKPAINENNPDNWQRVKACLERRQYGQESMITRMFNRRAKLDNQFGNYPHMGFWGYFKKQYSNDFWGLLRYLPFLIGLFGMYLTIRKSYKNGFLIFAIFLISSLGLILYLNFSDGTRTDHLEVRDRDYFYTPAYIYFALIIGLGLSVILSNLMGWLAGRIPSSAAKPIWAAAALIAVLIPLDTLAYHYHSHDRTGDYKPFDYAYNIRNSCEQDAIIFTNGDNDTFPLWYLQEVEHIRQDVRVVNLSLINTDWYILQLKHQMNVPIDLTDEQIIWQPAGKVGKIQLYQPADKYYDPIRKINRYLIATRDSLTGKVTRVQDQMIEHIVLANRNHYPIYFSSSVPVSNRWSLSDYVVKQAMALKIMLRAPQTDLDPETTEELLTNVYSYRGVDDLNVIKDENNVGLTSTYPERFIELATYWRNQGDTTKAIDVLRKSIVVAPYYYQNYIELIKLYAASAKSDSSDYYYNLGIENLNTAIESWPDITLYWQFKGVMSYERGAHSEAIMCYEKALEMDPSSSITFRLLLQLYYETQQMNKALELLIYWMDEHPEDMEARNIYNSLKQYRR